MSQVQKRKAGAASQAKLTTPKKGRGRPSLAAAAGSSSKKGVVSRVQKAQTGGKGRKTGGKRRSAASESAIERGPTLSRARILRDSLRAFSDCTQLEIHFLTARSAATDQARSL